jgi:hypothetical protein
MGTRSRIAVMHGSVCKSVYCHWDGYLEYNGSLLQKHYDSTKANQLVALGDLSSLKPEIGIQHAFGYHGTEISAEDYEKQFGEMCTFYGRDRGEKGVDYKVAHTFAEFFEQVDNCGGEWYYVMQDGVWYVGNVYERDAQFYKKLVPLTEALAKLPEETEVA